MLCRDSYCTLSDAALKKWGSSSEGHKRSESTRGLLPNARERGLCCTCIVHRLYGGESPFHQPLDYRQARQGQAAFSSCCHTNQRGGRPLSNLTPETCCFNPPAARALYAYTSSTHVHAHVHMCTHTHIHTHVQALPTAPGMTIDWPGQLRRRRHLAPKTSQSHRGWSSLQSWWRLRSAVKRACMCSCVKTSPPNKLIPHMLPCGPPQTGLLHELLPPKNVLHEREASLEICWGPSGAHARHLCPSAGSLGRKWTWLPWSGPERCWKKGQPELLMSLMSLKARHEPRYEYTCAQFTIA